MSSTLRSRLLLGFSLVAIPPLVILSSGITVLTARSFRQTTDQRLVTALDVVRNRLEAMRQRAAAQVAAAAREDLPGLSAESEETDWAEGVGARRGLPAFEIVGPEGRLLSSRHWPAGLGFEDRDRVFPGDSDLRLEKVSEGYGMGERLALTASTRAEWRGKPVVVRGGYFLDPPLLEDLTRSLGLDVGLRDAERGSWLCAPGSPLLDWPAPLVDGSLQSGEVALPTGVSLWVASSFRAGVPLVIVVAMPRRSLDRLISRILGLTGGIAVVALLLALGVGFVLSARVARPIRELAEGARRVSEGDWETRVESDRSDEIGDLARAFNTMTAEIRESRELLVRAERVAAWREMARRLAHELKNPLFPIQVSIETMRRAAVEGRDLASLVRDSSDTLLDELRSLRRIVDEFSEFARLPRPTLVEIDLNSLVRQVLDLEKSRAGAVTIETSLATDLPTVRADGDLLARALGNLVKNALETMPESGRLRITSSFRNPSVIVEVADTGPGIKPEDRALLFTPYFTTKPGGTGLGLVVTQSIVADHGGRIEVRNQPGAGAVFAIFLPAAGSPPGGSHPRSLEEPNR